MTFSPCHGIKKDTGDILAASSTEGEYKRINILIVVEGKNTIISQFLRYFREELAANGFPSNIHHAEHCLSMLREFTLCAADTALERGDQFQRNYTVDRVTGEHECMDIELFYGTLWKLWNKWVDVRDKVSESM